MFRRTLAMAIFAFAAGPASAFGVMDCETVDYVDGATAQAAQGVSVELPVYPGAFGGPVHCIMRGTNDLRVFELVVQGGSDLAIEYRPGQLTVALGQPTAPEATFVYCEPAEVDAFFCQLDLLLGSGAWLRRYWSDEGTLSGAEFFVFAQEVLRDTDLLDMFMAAGPEDRNIAAQIRGETFLAGQLIHLEDSPTPESFALQDADFLFEMIDQFDTRQVGFTLHVRASDGDDHQIYLSEQPAAVMDTLWFYLLATEQLMRAGPEASRDIRF